MGLKSLFRKKEAEELQKILEEREARRKVKAEHRLLKRENKLREKRKSQSIKEKQYWFNFFTKWFFLGIILILLSICVSSYVNSIDTNILKYYRIIHT